MPEKDTEQGDGAYAKALASEEDMEHLLRRLDDEQANATNMDW
jgi:hypothetical protein